MITICFMDVEVVVVVAAAVICTIDVVPPTNKISVIKTNDILKNNGSFIIGMIRVILLLINSTLYIENIYMYTSDCVS